MTREIKVGNVYLQLQDNRSSIGLASPTPPLVIEQPDSPVLLPEKERYAYRPNDPFQFHVDEAHAVASISSGHKPWVRRTWFILFVIGPLVLFELAAAGVALGSPPQDAWKVEIIFNVLLLPIWLVYFAIWRRKVKR